MNINIFSAIFFGILAIYCAIKVNILSVQAEPEGFQAYMAFLIFSGVASAYFGSNCAHRKT